MVPGGVKRVKAVANSELHSKFPKRNGFFGVKQKNQSLGRMLNKSWCVFKLAKG